ncbi:lipoprotein [Spiroplasma tabanidicola]|uniref:Uncharacterized protein n=1 Tax=Spiroplasma tabanidicola TaxID=324079 RepID=A0A6I6C6L9_9MOLU|nr:lipoprotein [Spiroplasma tabanidicola]QGS51830.1 hypothetical protein STABA_v1c04670 [Spiroplasma tabanidicola]
MKKLLIILGGFSFICSTSIEAIACKPTVEFHKKDLKYMDSKYSTITPDSNDIEAVKKAAFTSMYDKYFKKFEETTDIVFSDFVEATSEKNGSIVATAADTSEIVTGTVTFVVKYKAPSSK